MILSLVVIALLSACRNEFDFEEHYPGGEIKKEYADNWVKQMGEIDPNQDWTLAGEYCVTVDVPGEDDVKVYALGTDGVYQLVGEYFGVSGLTKLIIDAEKGTEKLLVTIGGTPFETVVGGVVSPNTQTRSVENGTLVTNPDKWKYFKGSDITKWLDKCSSLLDFLRSDVKPNYSYVASSNKIVVYPLYWKTNQTDEVGIYYESNNRTNYYPVFKTNGGAELEYKNGSSWTVCGTNNSTRNNNSTTEYRSKGIEVTLPAGCTSFGLYVKHGVVTIHSDNSKNLGFIKCANFTVDGKQYISLGDKIDFGIGDIILQVEGAFPIDNSLKSWIIACEDLGSTGDYDFNDLVLKFEKKVEGTSYNPSYKLRITPLAAGGTLRAVCKLGNDLIGEVHELLGAGTPVSQGRYLMINTNAPQGQGVDGKTATAWVKNYTKDFSISEELKKFTIEVGSVSPVIVSSPEKGQAPQMIVVPNSWEWTKERVDIRDAYHGFENWSSDATNTEWTSHKAKDGNGNLCPFFYEAPNR